MERWGLGALAWIGGTLWGSARCLEERWGLVTLAWIGGVLWGSARCLEDWRRAEGRGVKNAGGRKEARRASGNLAGMEPGALEPGGPGPWRGAWQREAASVSVTDVECFPKRHLV
jgi:hypothetical protein